MRDATASNDFLPTASWENLRLRAELLRRLREFFDGRGFLEVETPILSADTVIDRHSIRSAWTVGEQVSAAPNTAVAADAAAHPVRLPPSRAPRMWLQTSPEFPMKRLLAAGAGPIYQVARVFRQDELARCTTPSSRWSSGIGRATAWTRGCS